MAFQTGTMASTRDFWENKLKPFITLSGWTINEDQGSGTIGSLMIESGTGRSFANMYSSNLDFATRFYFSGYALRGFTPGQPVTGQPGYSSSFNTGFSSGYGVTFPLTYWMFGTPTYLYIVVAYGTKWYQSMAFGEADRFSMTADVGQFVLQNTPDLNDINPVAPANGTNMGYLSPINSFGSPSYNATWDGTQWRRGGWHTYSSSWVSNRAFATRSMLAVETDLYAYAIQAAERNASSVNVSFPLLFLGAQNERTGTADPDTWENVFYGQMPDVMFVSMNGLEDEVPISIGGDQWIPFRRNQGPTYNKVGYMYKVTP